MIEALDRLVEDVSGLNSKLVLLIGHPRTGKSSLLGRLAENRQMRLLNVGMELGRKLLSVSSTRRHLQATDMLKELADDSSHNGLLIMDNIEILFDQTLKLSPLELLKRHAHARRVVAAYITPAPNTSKRCPRVVQNVCGRRDL